MKFPQLMSKKLTLIGSLACLAFAAMSLSATLAQAALIVANQQDAFLGTQNLRDESTLANIPGTTFSDPANITTPAGIAVGPDNNIYVTGFFSGRVARFDGTTLAPLGLFADVAGAAPAATPGKLNFAPNGDLYVSDSSNGNIHKFQGPAGVTPGSYIGPALNTSLASGFFLAFAFDPNSADIIVGVGTPAFQAELYRVNPAGVATQIGGLGIGGLVSASDIEFGPNGEMYVADALGNQVVRFDDANGTNPIQFTDFPDPVTVVPPFTNFPLDILIMGGDTLLVALGGETNLPDPVHGALRRYNLSDGLEQPGSVTDINPVSALALLPDAIAVPEPSTGLLLGLGGIGMCVARRRARSGKLNG